MDIGGALARRYPQAHPGDKWSLIDDGSGIRVHKWSSDLGPVPDAEQLAVILAEEIAAEATGP